MKRPEKGPTKAERRRQNFLKSLQRPAGERTLAQRVLIVCEDDKSAPQYFRALKGEFKLSATSVVVAGSGGETQPLQVVGKAIALKKEAASEESGTLPFEHVWCVIDGDYGDKIVNARSRAEAHGIRLAITTMCFEYWILLHFEDHRLAAHDCDEVVSRLRRSHIPGYQKGKCDFGEVVKDVREACGRARRIRTPEVEGYERPEKQNPCSEIYKLVDSILIQLPS